MAGLRAHAEIPRHGAATADGAHVLAVIRRERLEFERHVALVGGGEHVRA